MKPKAAISQDFPGKRATGGLSVNIAKKVDVEYYNARSGKLSLCPRKARTSKISRHEIPFYRLSDCRPCRSVAYRSPVESIVRRNPQPKCSA